MLRCYVYRICVLLGTVGALLIASFSSPCAGAQDSESTPAKAAPAAAAKTTAEPAKAEPKFPEWSKVTEGAKLLEGLFPLYYNEKDQKLLMVIQRNQYNEEFILPISIARGAGSMYLGGDTLNFGNQWILSFQRKADRILVIRRNVKVKADDGSPQADSVKVSYSDSVIAAPHIKAEEHDGEKVLIDLADLLMTDLAGIGVNPDHDRSTWAKVKAFPENVEIEVSAVFNMAGGFYYYFFGGDSIADPRGRSGHPLRPVEAAFQRLQIAPGRRSRGSLPEHGQGLLHGYPRPSPGARRHAVELGKEQRHGGKIAPQETDRVLDRKNRAARIPPLCPCGHP